MLHLQPQDQLKGAEGYKGPLKLCQENTVYPMFICSETVPVTCQIFYGASFVENIQMQTSTRLHQFYEGRGP